MPDQPGTTTLPPLPSELAEQLQRHAAEMGMSLATYLAFLEQHRQNRIDGALDAAIRFMFREHGESFRKLAE